MESYMQKLAKKKEPALTILPVLQEKHDHGATCGCGEEGCGDAGEGGCCGG